MSRGTDASTDVYPGQAPQPLVSRRTPATWLVLINRRGQIASMYRIP